MVEDLGSHNGTRVNGERIDAPRELHPGDVVTVGSATLVFHRDAQSRSRQRVLPPDQLRERIVEEAERARRHARPMCVVAVVPSEAGADQHARLAEAAACKLRVLVAGRERHTDLEPVARPPSTRVHFRPLALQLHHLALVAHLEHLLVNDRK